MGDAEKEGMRVSVRTAKELCPNIGPWGHLYGVLQHWSGEDKLSLVLWAVKSEPLDSVYSEGRLSKSPVPKLPLEAPCCLLTAARMWPVHSEGLLSLSVPGLPLHVYTISCWFSEFWKVVHCLSRKLQSSSGLAVRPKSIILYIPGYRIYILRYRIYIWYPVEGIPYRVSLYFIVTFYYR